MIDWASPADLEPYNKACKVQAQRQDSQLHMMGMYALSAVQVAIERSLYGKKAKAKYIEKPILSEEVEKNSIKTTEELTEEEKKRQTEKLFTQLKIMGANFNLNHKG